MAMVTLATWGAITFEIWPLNIHEVDHNTSTDWARKEIIGAPIYREWVGENDEEIHYKGRMTPVFFARWGKNTGMSAMEAMEQLRLAGHADVLMRGDGYKLGWFVIDRLVRQHTNLSGIQRYAGVGQIINFDVAFQRVPVPGDPTGYYNSLTAVVPGGGV
jgi:phage protein U